ncbi:unnamed protein product [Rotaria sp. Silwood1]|nr:unnamed protein product [Rotaria sp. Silwood1]
MDLIDMRSICDGEYKWILHTKDHFTEFSWAYPLKTTETAYIAEKLLRQFYLFGTPRILQSNNGKEFVAKVIRDLRSKWPDLLIINGRSNHSQMQGSVECGNQTLESAVGLAQVIYSINTRSTQSIDNSPYEAVFGQKARSDNQLRTVLLQQGVLNEEDLPHEFSYGGLEYDNLMNAVKVTTSDTNKTLACMDEALVTASNIPLSTASLAVCHTSLHMKKRRRTRLFSNDQIASLDKGKMSAYTRLTESVMISFL